DEQQFGIGRLPEQEVGEAMFARGADEEVERWQAVRVERALDRRLVDLPRLGRRPRRPDDLGAPAIIERDRERHPAIARGLLHRLVDHPGDVRLEGLVVAEDPETDALLVETGELAL